MQIFVIFVYYEWLYKKGACGFSLVRAYLLKCILKKELHREDGWKMLTVSALGASLSPVRNVALCKFSGARAGINAAGERVLNENENTACDINIAEMKAFACVDCDRAEKVKMSSKYTTFVANRVLCKACMQFF
jgi:hypothetical protein